MHISGNTILITVIGILSLELSLLFFQILYTVQRAHDRGRRKFLMLLFLIIQFNIIASIQYTQLGIKTDFLYLILKYGAGFLMATYFLHYLENSIGIDFFGKYLHRQNIVPIALIFLICFVAPFSITKDEILANRLLLIPPAIYCLRFLYGLTMQIQKICPVVRQVNPKSYLELICAYLGAISWLVVAVSLFIHGIDLQVFQGFNLGFFFVALAYLVTTTKESKQEIAKFQAQINDLLTHAARFERTAQVMHQVKKHFYELLISERALTPELDNYIKNHLITLEEWHEFDTLMALTHHSFYHHIRNKYPQLNEKEIRHLGLIKLSCDTDLIAKLLEVKKESLRTLRFRLKKKMGITDQDLATYVMRLSLQESGCYNQLYKV